MRCRRGSLSAPAVVAVHIVDRDTPRSRLRCELAWDAAGNGALAQPVKLR
jgi:hypothetical protein